MELGTSHVTGEGVVEWLVDLLSDCIKSLGSGVARDVEGRPIGYVAFRPCIAGWAVCRIIGRFTNGAGANAMWAVCWLSVIIASLGKAVNSSFGAASREREEHQGEYGKHGAW